MEITHKFEFTRPLSQNRKKKWWKKMAEIDLHASSAQLNWNWGMEWSNYRVQSVAARWRKNWNDLIFILHVLWRVLWSGCTGGTAASYSSSSCSVFLLSFPTQTQERVKQSHRPWYSRVRTRPKTSRTGARSFRHCKMCIGKRVRLIVSTLMVFYDQLACCFIDL